MATTAKPTPEITRAAERYLEQYGDPLVMNTYLKVAILVLAVVSLVLAGLVYRSQMALAHIHPLVIRIDKAGRADGRQSKFPADDKQNSRCDDNWTNENPVHGDGWSWSQTSRYGGCLRWRRPREVWR